MAQQDVAHEVAPERIRRGSVDVVLAAAAISLIGFGVVMVYSASAVEATVRYNDPEHFVRRQGVYALMALVIMFVVGAMDYRWFRKLTYPSLAVSLGLLVLTVFGFGHSAKNAERWLSLGPIHVQPAEVAKVALVLWLAHSLSKKRELIRTFSVGFIPHMIVVGLMIVLCMKQPDFGSSVILAGLSFVLLFVAGARFGYLLGAASSVIALGAILVQSSSYRYARYLSWLNIETERLGMAYQPYQSVMSFGSGGWTGLGIGRGLQVLYLPEAHNDFISAIIGEELGFVGVVMLCAVFGVFAVRAVQIALRAVDDFGTFLGFGLATLFSAQVIVNLAVAMALLPTKGLTLPFISYGGSSLMVSAAGVGMLLAISRYKAEPLPEPEAETVSAALRGAAA